MKIKIINEFESEEYAGHGIPMGTITEAYLEADRDGLVYVTWKGVELGLLEGEYEIIEENS